jgi:hypothetical protein
MGVAAGRAATGSAPLPRMSVAAPKRKLRLGHRYRPPAPSQGMNKVEKWQGSKMKFACKAVSPDIEYRWILLDRSSIS